MKPRHIRLFIKPYCGWCHEAIRWLDRHGFRYKTLDVTADPAAWQEMRAISAQTLAPVIEVEGRVLADFGVDELEQWWGEQGFDD